MPSGGVRGGMERTIMPGKELLSGPVGRAARYISFELGSGLLFCDFIIEPDSNRRCPMAAALASFASFFGPLASPFVIAILSFGFFPWQTCLAHADDAKAYSGKTVQLTVDARDILRRVVTSKLIIPAKPGPMTLHFPKWIPGTHGPFGPITKVAGVQLRAKGQLLLWKRDSINLFAFHCEVPTGVDAAPKRNCFTYCRSAAESLEVSVGIVASTQMAILNWNALVLYPEGADQSQILFKPRLLLPAGWRCASGLHATSEASGVVEFEPVTLERLIDSPVLAGAHLRTIHSHSRHRRAAFPRRRHGRCTH